MAGNAISLISLFTTIILALRQFFLLYLLSRVIIVLKMGPNFDLNDRQQILFLLTFAFEGVAEVGVAEILQNHLSALK